MNDLELGLKESSALLLESLVTEMEGKGKMQRFPYLLINTDAPVTEKPAVLDETAEETIVRMTGRIKELEDARKVIHCSFCGFLAERPEEPGAISLLMAGHITNCEKHPLHKAVKENDRLRRMGLVLLRAHLHDVISNEAEANAEYDRRKKEWEFADDR